MDKEKMKKQMEGFKQKIYFELQNNTSEVLIFGNDRFSSTCGEMDKVMFKFASMIIQIAQQTGYSENRLLKDIKSMIKIYKKLDDNE